jgi:hypothetical protein
MEDPQGAIAHALKTLKKPDGIVMIVEPFANDIYDVRIYK